MQDKNRSECKTRLDTRVLQNIPIFHTFVELTNGTYIKKSKFLLYNSTSKNFVQIVISNEGETSPSGTIITAFFFQKRNVCHTRTIYSCEDIVASRTSRLAITRRRPSSRIANLLCVKMRSWEDQLRTTRRATLLFQIQADGIIIRMVTFSFFLFKKKKKKKLYLSLRCGPSESRSDLVCSSPCTCMRRDRCFCRRDAAPAYRSGTLPDVDSSVTPSRL